MHAVSFSSGDILADRRANYAKLLAEEGDFAAAAELMEQALERVPDWRAGWFQLGEFREKAGARNDAITAFEQVLQMAGDDIFGAQLKLAVLGAADVPASPESAYAESLFDDYADRFEKALTEGLGYDVPTHLAKMVAGIAGPEPFALAVDIGCGTGLAGLALRPLAVRLEGFDISANMLAKAEEKCVYDVLGRADLSLEAGESGLFEPGFASHRASLVVAADVLIYLGDLENVFALVAALLVPGGLFAFSVEATEEAGFVLQPSLRYAHSRTHVEALFVRHGLVGRLCEQITVRMDAGVPIAGLAFVAERRG